MTPNDLRRLALTLPGVEESSHMGSADFRIGGRIFATLAHERQGYGNLMLTPEQQQLFLTDRPDLFLPIAGGWGRQGMTHVRLAEATESELLGALTTAYNLRLAKNTPAKRAKKRL